MTVLRFPRTGRDAFARLANPDRTLRQATHAGALQPARWRSPWWAVATAPVWLPVLAAWAVAVFVVRWIAEDSWNRRP